MTGPKPRMPQIINDVEYFGKSPMTQGPKKPMTGPKPRMPRIINDDNYNINLPKKPVVRGPKKPTKGLKPYPMPRFY